MIKSRKKKRFFVSGPRCAISLSVRKYNAFIIYTVRKVYTIKTENDRKT